MFGPDRTQFLNYVRTIEVTHDGRRWIFSQSGDLQAFEHPDRYRARSIPDRFPPELLDEYCQALGIRYFDSTFYQSQGTFVESRVPMSADVKVMSLPTARQWLGIEAP